MISSADIATTDKPLFYAGQRCFDCPNEDMFWDLPIQKRKHKQWYKKFYGGENEIASWCRDRRNKNKKFFIRSNGMIREVEND